MHETNLLCFRYTSTPFNDSFITDPTPTDADQIYSVEYSSETDANLYTVSLVNDEPLTTAEQSAVYLLEIRNILLIFLLSWLVLTLYSKIKNTFTNFFGKE